MKLRRFLLVVLLVGGFWYLTTHLPSGSNHLSLTWRARRQFAAGADRGPGRARI